MSKFEPCIDCGRPNKRGGSYCSRCYMHRYRMDPGVRAKHNARVMAYNRAHAEKRRGYRRKTKVWHAAIDSVFQ